MTNRTEKVATNVVIPKLHKEMLSHLSKETRITQSVFLREAVWDLLKKYKKEFAGTKYEPVFQRAKKASSSKREERP